MAKRDRGRDLVSPGTIHPGTGEPGTGEPGTGRPTGAYRAGGPEGESKKGGSVLKKLALALLGLLLLALLIFALIALLGGDDDDGKGDSGQLTAEGMELLPPPASGLSSLAGSTAVGKATVVQSVNGNEGFFVGSSASDRVYVEWGGDVGENEPSQFQPEKGQKVDLAGPLKAATLKEVAKLKLTAGDARFVKSQGGFVNADEVTAAE